MRTDCAILDGRSIKLLQVVTTQQTTPKQARACHRFLSGFKSRTWHWVPSANASVMWVILMHDALQRSKAAANSLVYDRSLPTNWPTLEALQAWKPSWCRSSCSPPHSATHLASYSLQLSKIPTSSGWAPFCPRSHFLVTNHTPRLDLGRPCYRFVRADSHLLVPI